MPDVGNLVEMYNQAAPYLTKSKDYAIAASVLFYLFVLPAIFLKNWYLEEKKHVSEWAVGLLEEKFGVDKILEMGHQEIMGIQKPMRKLYALEVITNGSDVEFPFLFSQSIRGSIMMYAKQVKDGHKPTKVLEEALKHPDIRNYFLSGLKRA